MVNCIVSLSIVTKFREDLTKTYSVDVTNSRHYYVQLKGHDLEVPRAIEQVIYLRRDAKLLGIVTKFHEDPIKKLFDLDNKHFWAACLLIWGSICSLTGVFVACLVSSGVILTMVSLGKYLL